MSAAARRLPMQSEDHHAPRGEVIGKMYDVKAGSGGGNRSIFIKLSQFISCFIFFFFSKLVYLTKNAGEKRTIRWSWINVCIVNLRVQRSVYVDDAIR